MAPTARAFGRGTACVWREVLELRGDGKWGRGKRDRWACKSVCLCVLREHVRGPRNLLPSIWLLISFTLLPWLSRKGHLLTGGTRTVIWLFSFLSLPLSAPCQLRPTSFPNHIFYRALQYSRGTALKADGVLRSSRTRLTLIRKAKYIQSCSGTNIASFLFLLLEMKSLRTRSE